MVIAKERNWIWIQTRYNTYSAQITGSTRTRNAIQEILIQSEIWNTTHGLQVMNTNHNTNVIKMLITKQIMLIIVIIKITIKTEKNDNNNYNVKKKILIIN